jgi:hypothetical protein
MQVFLVSVLALTLGRVVVDDFQRLYAVVIEIFTPHTTGDGAHTPAPDRHSAPGSTVRTSE